MAFAGTYTQAITRFTTLQPDPLTGAKVLPFLSSDGLLQLLSSLPGVGAENVHMTVTADDVRYALHLNKTLNRTYSWTFANSQMALEK